MNTLEQQTSARRMHTPQGLEIRYERGFLRDLKQLEPAAACQLQKFVFEDFYQINQIQELPEFRQLGTSGIFYRFTLDHYLISLEVTGQIVKFLRVLPKPTI
ncbi:cytotoxic translational repressor of toxin-antitoxin stability system [Pantanalinema rosaneae CENA516]|uniref:cytotoxic translational repressor of toxin-antitoxin stability system n=1 Tax=Pantanalinema rosaneae TaxID=1620701 RepID=UPI003D6DC147